MSARANAATAGIAESDAKAGLSLISGAAESFDPVPVKGEPKATPMDVDGDSGAGGKGADVKAELGRPWGEVDVMMKATNAFLDLCHGTGEETEHTISAADKKHKHEDEEQDTEDLPYTCEVCVRGDDEELLLLCDICCGAYHTFCLNPTLINVPYRV